MRSSPPAMGFLWAVGMVCGLLVGCSEVRVWDIRPASTAQALRDALGERPFGEPDTPPSAMASPEAPAEPSPTLIRAKASFDEAKRREILSPDSALRNYAQSLVLASRSLSDSLQRGESNATAPSIHESRMLYNQALEGFLRLAGGRSFLPNDSWRAEVERRGVRVEIRRDDSVWSPERFDELRFAGDYVVTGMKHYHGSDGIGVPLIATRKPTEDELDHREGPERFYPFWEVYPVTAVIRFEASETGAPTAVLELHDTLKSTRVAMNGRMMPLASDLTTPTAYHFARGKLMKYEKISFFRPQDVKREAGLHMLHPYERGKIPIIMIHGLGSSPKAWAKVVNELRGDPALRERYQFWMYMYPTGNPFLISAAELRVALAEARATVDPNSSDPAYDQMVMIGHSMGGLITRLMLAESGEELWRLNSDHPFEQVVASPENRDLLGRVFHFRPVPYVKRAVFIATPHRGSKLGNEWIGRLGDSLIRIPGPIEKAHNKLIADNPPGFFKGLFVAGVPSSIDELQYENPYLMTIDRLPVNSGVKAHSIIGKVGDGPLETSSDNVVPYVSSRLDWVASEKIVADNHFCQDNDETIAELRRILIQHRDELDGNR